MQPKETIGFGRQQKSPREIGGHSSVLARFRRGIGAVLLGSLIGLAACAAPMQMARAPRHSAKSKPSPKVKQQPKAKQPAESAPAPEPNPETPAPKMEESSAPAPAPTPFPKFKDVEECVDWGYCDYA
jgi:hypothetical protein